MKLAFIMSWFGFDIPGGAEMELKGLVTHLKDAGVELEILTTCVKNFYTDWNENYYKPGNYEEKGITIRRFKVRKRDDDKFNKVNEKLMANKLPLTDEEEEIYTEEMVNSPDLYKYIRENKDNYDLFIFIPYMFGPTYHGIKEVPEKAVMIPCFHDESYIYMRRFKEAFKNVAGMIFHAQPESDLAHRVYDLSKVNAQVLGEGVYTEVEYDAKRFREKFNINDPFVLYAGRKDAGKNIYTLIKYFSEYKKRNKNDVKLVLIGGGEVQLPENIKDDVIDLGFVDVQDKFDACAAAELLCQPSKNESFSLVVMESWLCERPVLVHDKCNVTRYFASTANAGLYFDNYFEFEGAVEYVLNNKDEAAEMGRNGRKFVLDNFAWDVIVDKYTKYFQEIIDKNR
jgi:glycosyltransferase involved in cell wall biosynthesis